MSEEVFWYAKLLNHFSSSQKETYVQKMKNFMVCIKKTRKILIMEELNRDKSLNLE